MRINLSIERAAAAEAISAQEMMAKARAKLESLQQYLDRCRLGGTLHVLDAEIKSALNEALGCLRG